MKKQPKAKKVPAKGRGSKAKLSAPSIPSSAGMSSGSGGGNQAALDPRDEPYTFMMIGENDHYPALDKVAHLAAIVLKGDTFRGINAAVRTALHIYDCCYAWYDEKNLEMASSQHSPQEFDPLFLTEFYTYDEAIKAITGQGRPKRAREYFSDFQIFRLTNRGTLKISKEISKKSEEWILEKKQSGFFADEVVQLRREFKKYFPTRRKKI